jgi:hypothetical protein
MEEIETYSGMKKKNVLKVLNLNEKIKGQQESRYKHILGKATHRLSNMLLNYKPRGQRGR